MEGKTRNESHKKYLLWHRVQIVVLYLIIIYLIVKSYGTFLFGFTLVVGPIFIIFAFPRNEYKTFFYRNLFFSSLIPYYVLKTKFFSIGPSALLFLFTTFNSFYFLKKVFNYNFSGIVIRYFKDEEDIVCKSKFIKNHRAQVVLLFFIFFNELSRYLNSRIYLYIFFLIATYYLIRPNIIERILRCRREFYLATFAFCAWVFIAGGMTAFPKLYFSYTSSAAIIIMAINTMYVSSGAGYTKY